MANEYRVYQTGGEVVAGFSGTAASYSISAEVVRSIGDGTIQAIINGMSVEVIRSISDVPTATRRRQVMAGSF